MEFGTAASMRTQIPHEINWPAKILGGDSSIEIFKSPMEHIPGDTPESSLSNDDIDSHFIVHNLLIPCDAKRFWLEIRAREQKY